MFEDCEEISTAESREINSFIQTKSSMKIISINRNRRKIVIHFLTYLIKGNNSAFSVDRDRLRERERQARAAMSVQAEQAAAGGGSDTRHHHHGHHNHAHHHANPHAVAGTLFRAPVRFSYVRNKD
ncbi:hypothetical protein ANTPLA_LOCUS10265 [Anthophora plagiata]